MPAIVDARVERFLGTRQRIASKANGMSAEQPHAPRARSMDRVSGSLVNAILGALILWVGQTTFRHAGVLASVDERFGSVGVQFTAVDDRHDSLRGRLEQVVLETVDRTRSRFTSEDGDKISLRIEEISDHQAMLERQLLERLTGIQLKVMALETRGSSSQEVAVLRAELERMRAIVSQQTHGHPVYQNALRSDANTGPVHLPPTTQR